jgi:hypothetical protein
MFADTLRQAGIGERDLNEWKQGFIHGSYKILNMKFSPDGRLLFCATTNGLRVLEWEKILASDKVTPEPLFASVPSPEASLVEHRQYENYIYDVILDEARHRLLFCGIEGTIRFLNLTDGNSGILLNPPGQSPTSKLQISPDREFICCLSGPPFHEKHETPWRLQIWNYAALCKAAGLE